MNEGATFRGVIKNNAREAALTHYGLLAGNSTASEQAIQTRERVKDLVGNWEWLKVCSLPFALLF